MKYLRFVSIFTFIGILILGLQPAPKPSQLAIKEHFSIAFGLTDESTDWVRTRNLIWETPQTPRPLPSSPIIAIKPIAVAIWYPGPYNHFFYGQCTWYVATRRYIPWWGSAWQWLANAIAYGYREGLLPRVGAIMVMGNHVAFVEAVYSNTSWLVAEMNWWQNGGGWGRVDRRIITGTAWFIY